MSCPTVYYFPLSREKNRFILNNDYQQIIGKFRNFIYFLRKEDLDILNDTNRNHYSIFDEIIAMKT